MRSYCFFRKTAMAWVLLMASSARVTSALAASTSARGADDAGLRRRPAPP